MLQKRKNALVRLFCCALVLMLLYSLFACKKGSDVPLSTGLSMIEGSPVYEDNVAMRTDNFIITPGMMAYFFYSYGATVMAQMQTVKPYDNTRSLHDQMYNEELSFYDVIMNETLYKVSQLLIYCEAARAEGTLMTREEYDKVEQTVEYYRVMAAADHGLTLEEYLTANYGKTVNEKDFVEALQLEAWASGFSLVLKSRLEGEITQREAQEYASANGLEDETLSRNIAYLHLPFEYGTAPEEKIAQVTSAMQKSPTEESLRALSELGTVGVEKNMTPENSGIKAIGEWLFAEGRSVGDWGRIDLSGATYILLYTENGISFGEASARMKLFDASFASWYNGWVESLEFGYNYDCLDSYDIEKE